MNQVWKKIPCRKTELQLKPTLNGGQSFRWKEIENNQWIGVFNNIIWILSQNDEHLLYQTYKGPSEHPGKNTASDEEQLKSYFRLDVNLEECYNQWTNSDEFFKESCQNLHGIRMLNQNVTENIFSFICSSNNNISRITSMVEKLCVAYGSPISTVNEQQYHGFPTVESLSDPSVEGALRKAGFGYRAKFIYQSACRILELGGCDWLDRLKLLQYDEAKGELLKLPGVGAKVADCVCLMSLNHLQAIPVDTHVYQIASSRYLPHLKTKSVTQRVYQEIGEHFRMLYGQNAGWAQTVLFCADLKSFKEKSERKSKRRKTS